MIRVLMFVFFLLDKKINGHLSNEYFKCNLIKIKNAKADSDGPSIPEEAIGRYRFKTQRSWHL